MKKTLLIVLLLSAKAAVCQTSVTSYRTQAEADSAALAWLAEDKELDQMVVTATRTPKALKDVPVLTRMITSSDIKKTDATNIQDLMQQELPGVEFSYAMSQKVNMNLAGFSGQGVLFLVDSERLAGETQENIDFARLNMSNVERIEIVKGASSALYGSNAAGGVINIITKDATRNADGSFSWKANVNMRCAAHNEHRGNCLLTCSKGIVSNTVSMNRTSIDSYDVESAPNPAAMVFSTVYGDETFNLKDQFTIRPLSDLKLVGRAGYFFRQTERTAGEPERYRDFSGGLRAVYEPSTKNNLEIAYSFDQYDKSDFLESKNLDIRDYSNVQNSLRGLYNHSLRSDEDVLTIGADYMHDYIQNYFFTDGTHSQNTADAFVQYDCKLSPDLEIVGAARYDYFSDGSDMRLTPKLSARYQVGKFNFRASYGMGFRAPTLKEKYTNFDMLSIWIIEGNPQLQAEKSQSSNISVDWRKGCYDITAAGYFNLVSDRITTTSPQYHADGTRFIQYINLQDLKVYGAELSANARWNSGLGSKLSYSYCHEDFDSKSMSNIMPAREHSMTARMDYDRKCSKNYGFNVSLSGRFLSSIDNLEYADILDDNSIHSVHYPAYTIWKFSMVNRICDWLQITLSVDNVFNYKPEYYYYNAPLTTGANCMVGASVDIDKLCSK